MPLLESLMRRLGYAKLDRFGLSLAANHRVISHNRRAMALAGDWVVGWRVEDSLVTGEIVNFDERVAAPASPPRRAQTARQEFGTGLIALPEHGQGHAHAARVRPPSSDERAVVQAEAKIVMQSDAREAPEAEADAGRTLAMAPSTAQLVAATAGPDQAEDDEEEWAWMMARARAAEQAAITAELPKQPAVPAMTVAMTAAMTQATTSADDEEAEEFEWRLAMARARAAAANDAVADHAVASVATAGRADEEARPEAARGPATDRELEIPIIVATPQYAMAAVVGSIAQGLGDAQPLPQANNSNVTASRARAAAGTEPAPFAAMTAPRPLRAPTAVPPAAMRGEPPHLRAATASQPVMLHGHTARLNLGAIPPMPGTDATRRTRPTASIAAGPHDVDNDPVIAPPRPQEGTAPRLLRPLPPLPGKAFARPHTSTQAPLRPVPRVARITSAPVMAAPRLAEPRARTMPASESSRLPRARRLATAS